MAGNLVLVRTESQYRLTSTFLRFQEHYESPRFRGEIFSLEEFMDWYAKRYGNFTYCEDWIAFNIPSSIFTPFREGRFNPLSNKEHRLLELLSDIPEPFYTVGLFGKKLDLPDLKHELVHGLYYTVPAYRNDVRQIVSRIGRESPIFTSLDRAGYHAAVHEDEANAYLLMGAGSDLADDGFRWTPDLRNTKKELEDAFKRHFSFSLHRANESAILSHFTIKEL